MRFTGWWKTDRALASTAALLRRFHDVTEGLDLGPQARWSAELTDPRGGEVICHNDVCPENVVYRDGAAVALPDFDYAAPGRRVYDLALELDPREFVDAIFDAVRVGEAFVRRHVEAGDPGFVAMWEDRGGEQRSNRRARWLDDNRARLLNALS
jgi:aminoglycoside phosphotransferase (APT) family kinase protein